MWLPRLGPHLPVAVPQPVAVGEPGEGYPFQWGVYRWLEGAPLDFDTLSDPVRVAVDLAEFVTSLQALDTTGAPVPSDDPLDRGTPLAPRDPLFREAVWQLRDQYDSGLLLDAWEASLAADDFAGPPVWIHGDLLPGNLLVHRQRLHAVIDFATVRAADPAGELLAAWYVFQGESRRAFRDALGADERMWVRARGWALSLEIMASAYYRTRNPDSGEPSSVVTDILADFAADSWGATASLVSCHAILPGMMWPAPVLGSRDAAHERCPGFRPGHRLTGADWWKALAEEAKLVAFGVGQAVPPFIPGLSHVNWGGAQRQ